MPLNESAGLFSNLTEKQQQEAMQAVYGLPGEIMSPETLTYEDRVRMRRLLDQLDQKEASSTKEFDLNKPPVPAYQYQEFPFLMYNHESRQTKPAKNHQDRERMLDAGWSAEPFPSEPVEIPLTAAEHAEAEDINTKLKKRRA